MQKLYLNARIVYLEDSTTTNMTVSCKRAVFWWPFCCFDGFSDVTHIINMLYIITIILIQYVLSIAQ